VVLPTSGSQLGSASVSGFEGLSGRVLEAGVGTGRNFPFYPPDSSVVGIDISPAMKCRLDHAGDAGSARAWLTNAIIALIL
jgi:SAM-dependent methyltransferase